MKKVLLGLTILGYLSGCATNNAAQVRETYPVTIGFTGIQVRPTANIGIGASGEIFENEFHTCKNEESTFCSEKGEIKYDGDKKVAASNKSRHFSAYVNYFPWETSAFFIGAGATKKLTRSTLTLTDSDESIDYTAETLYARPAFGWNWIWESGFSLFIDFGVPIVVNQSQKLPDNASQEAKNAIKYLDKHVFNRFVIGGAGPGSSLIGWSFHF